MFKILYAMINHRLEGDVREEYVLPEGEYQMSIFKSEVEVEIDGELQVCPPNTCIIHKPGQKICFISRNGLIVGSWIRYNSDETMYNEFYLPFNRPIQCSEYEYFVRYWQSVADENYWKNESSEYIIDQLMHIILHRLHDYANEESRDILKETFVELRKNIYQHPEEQWTLQKMSGKVNLGVRAVQKYYKTYFGTACVNDVIESRLEKARYLLKETNQNIQQISFACGYNSFEHFCRQFKKEEGISPTEYRKRNSQL
ncbi:helix-turn-helix transcriptional regulator [Eubacterium xylanophilum]|uniref:helix-turn-helix transcriptional regulator n=1 Tax=Eubacterium xylanophilum TaxID=39497 RepID=UPI00047A65E1|nr:AraC family transcriptional regulator [Eubacterium xylanophilum]